jgi:hypothetical protein
MAGTGRTGSRTPGAEHHGRADNGVGLFDMTSFGKIRVEGRDAAAFLNHLRQRVRRAGRSGRLHPDAQREGRHRKRPDRDAAFGNGVPLVVTRRDLQRDLAWLRASCRRQLRHDHRHDGGRGRVLPSWGRMREIFYAGMFPRRPDERGLPLRHRARDRDRHGPRPCAPHLLCRRTRLGAVCLSDRRRMCSKRFDRGGPDHGLKLCGLHALDSCRIEKAFRHFGHDITDEDHVLEAGLGFAVKHAETRFHRPRRGPAQTRRGA